MKKAEADEIQRAIVAEEIYEAWKGWCGIVDKELYYTHEQVATAKHMIELGLDECVELPTVTFESLKPSKSGKKL